MVQKIEKSERDLLSIRQSEGNKLLRIRPWFEDYKFLRSVVVISPSKWSERTIFKRDVQYKSSVLRKHATVPMIDCRLKKKFIAVELVSTVLLYIPVEFSPRFLLSRREIRNMHEI